MEVVDSVCFFQRYSQEMFYVGFLQSSEAWFPICLVSDPVGEQRLDTLFVSDSYQLMAEMARDVASQVPEVKQTFVQFLMREEIQNLLDRYGLENMAVVVPEGEQKSCECGCGCS